MKSLKTKLKNVSVFTLEQSGYKAKIMEAKRLVGEEIHGLPSGKPIACIPIKCLPGCDESWVRRAGTYVVPIKREFGFWFDWRDNDEFNTAVISSIKGINPITGRKIDNIRMEQYREKCPIHDCELSHGNYCDECGYNIPYQNYISYPNVPMWQDGFRQADGSVRQFFFTEEDMRDVASAIIGKKNTVPAFGFAFYRCVNDRGSKEKPRSIGNDYSANSINNVPCDDCDLSSSPSCGGVIDEGSSGGFTDWSDSDGVVKHSAINNIKITSDVVIQNANSERKHLETYSFEIGKSDSFSEEKEDIKERFVKDVSVGAGARIKQNLALDKTPLGEWGEKPESLITLYFVFEEQLEAIIEKGGIKELKNKPQGYLENIPVG